MCYPGISPLFVKKNKILVISSPNYVVVEEEATFGSDSDTPGCAAHSNLKLDVLRIFKDYVLWKMSDMHLTHIAFNP